MSNTSSAKPGAANSQLPDDDALAAFAGGAFGQGRRRRDKDKPKATEAPATRPTSEPEPVQAVTEPPVPEEPPATAVEPRATEPQDEDQAATEAAAEKPSVPAPASSAETATPAPAAAPAKVPQPAVQQEEKEPQGQVAVRAVAAPEPATHRPVPLAYRGEVQIDQVHVPNLGPSGARATQCTIMVSQNVRDRFAHYQLSKKMAGEKEPSNALVVRRAFLHCKRGNLFGKLLNDVYHQNNAVDDEDYDEDGMLGEVVGRRAVRGRLKDSGQQSFRPSEQELANYDAFTQAYGFPSRSDFLNAVLDEFLPQLPTAGRRK